MNKNNLKYRLRIALMLCAGAAASAGLSSCGDDVDEGAYYTFTGHTASSFIHDNEEYSVFARLLDDTGNDALLSSYGHYTVFLPSDEVLTPYIDRMAGSYDNLTSEQKQEIVWNHVIKSGGRDYKSETFEEG